MVQFLKLFEPGKIGKMEIRNRIIMSPIGSLRYAQDGFTSDREIALWEARAKGGVGLIYKSVWGFSPALGPIFFPGHFDISDEAHIESARRFTQAIKTHGVRVACMLSHPGKHIILRRPDLKVVFGPSAIQDRFTGVIPKEMSTDEIHEFVEEFAESSKLAKMAGFEGVMFQGAHGYLINQFLSPRTNKRNDRYGGSVAKRARFACEIIKRTREKMGADFPIVIRMNGDDYVEGGLNLDEALQHARLFVEAGADALDVSAGPREAHHWQFITYSQPDGALVHLAAAIKKVVDVPVCTVGKITPQLAESVLKEGSADFTDFARSLIADPEWPNKVREGRLEDIRPCIYCNQCRERRTIRNDGPRQFCSVNSALGQEREYSLSMKPATSAKKVMVIGGGLAGMEVARTAAERGHEVSLYEKSGKLGGQWNIVTAYRDDQTGLLRYLHRGLVNAGVKVFLNQEITPQKVREVKSDVIVVATGAKPMNLDVPGSHDKNVVLAVDVLSGKVNAGQEVVIIGGRGVGLDTAIFLAKRGKKVSVVARSKIARDLVSAEKLVHWENLIKYGVYTYPDSLVDSITEKGVNIIYDGELIFLKADTVVMSIGYESENKLAEQLKGLVSELYTIGDCVEPRDVLAAINEGSIVGRTV